MILRRLAAAFALVVAGLASQLPEYTQQYRQRLGGALDEVRAAVARFDSEAAAESLTRQQGIERLQGNSDVLARDRGTAVADAAERTERLSRQQDAFRSAGPVSQYAVLAENFDPALAGATLHDYQPAAPLTMAGLVAAAIGFVIGWGLTRLVALPFRRRAFLGRPAAQAR